MPFPTGGRGCFVFSIFSFLGFVCTGSDPSIAVVSDTDAELVLECRSSGWFPEPELLWLDAEGNLLSAGPTETVRGSDDLYTVSSRVTVEKRHSSRYTCRVQQRTSNQTRDAHLTLKNVSSLDSLHLMCWVLIILILLAGGVIAADYWMDWKRRQSTVSLKPTEQKRAPLKNTTFYSEDKEEKSFSAPRHKISST